VSKAQANAFINHVGHSPDLQAAVSALTGHGVLAKLVEMGAHNGFAFTEDDYRAAVVDLAEGALSDEALDEVLRDAGFKS